MSEVLLNLVRRCRIAYGRLPEFGNSGGQTTLTPVSCVVGHHSTRILLMSSHSMMALQNMRQSIIIVSNSAAQFGAGLNADTCSGMCIVKDKPSGWTNVWASKSRFSVSIAGSSTR